jgi:tetratricopeptide (TPR) repeat protein
LLAAAASVASAQARDPRFEPITKVQLDDAVRKIPPTSGLNEVLIERAWRYGVTVEAYRLYTEAWEQHKSDAYANLWRGYAAQRCATAVLFGRIARATSPPFDDLMRVAEECLKRAAESRPEKPKAVALYGFFLFQFGNRQKEGGALLRRAVRMDARDPLIRDLLGDALSNYSGQLYQPGQAVTELLAAIQDDPQYAEPHYQLWFLYRQLGRQADADREKRAYDSMSYAAWGVAAPGVKRARQATNR